MTYEAENSSLGFAELTRARLLAISVKGDYGQGQGIKEKPKTEALLRFDSFLSNRRDMFATINKWGLDQ